jgi:uncharacterized short protein YbdD (DUF466 family)
MRTAPVADLSLRGRLARIARIVRRIIGAPDYERYLAHAAASHPGETPLTAEAFARDALARRYDRPGSRCC